MSVDASETIQQRWQDEQCPAMNGVLFADGGLVLFDHALSRTAEGHRAALGDAQRTSLAELLERDPDPWVYLTPLRIFEDPPRHTRFLCGEGEQGSYGFVAATHLSDDRLRWLAFFEESNPLTELALQPNHLVARSTLGQQWMFRLDDPSDVRVK